MHNHNNMSQIGQIAGVNALFRREGTTKAWLTRVGIRIISTSGVCENSNVRCFLISDFRFCWTVLVCRNLFKENGEISYRTGCSSPSCSLPICSEWNVVYNSRFVSESLVMVMVHTLLVKLHLLVYSRNRYIARCRIACGSKANGKHDGL